MNRKGKLNWRFVFGIAGLILALTVMVTLAVYMPAFLGADLTKAEIRQLSNFSMVFPFIAGGVAVLTISFELFNRFERDYTEWMLHGATH